MDYPSRIHPSLHAPGEDGRSLGSLVRELTADSSTLVRQEIALARAELKQNARELGRDVGRVAAGGVVALVGGLVLVAFLVALLGTLLGGNYWLSSLIVAVLLLGAGGFLVFRALRGMRSVSLAPRETITSLRTTQRWARAEVTELRGVLRGGEHPSTDGGGPSTDGGSPAGAARNRVAGLMGAPEAAAGAGGASEPLWKRVIGEIRNDDIAGEAQKVAYNAVMALPPALMVLLSLVGFAAGERSAGWIATQLQTAMPADAWGLVKGFVMEIVTQKHGGILSVGLLLALWGASGMFVALGGALDRAYDVKEPRSFVRERLVALGVMLGAVVLMLVSSITLLGGPQIADALDLWGAASVIWNVLQWPLAFLFVVAAFWLVYYVLPNRDQSACKKTLLIGAAISAALWLAATAAFRFYIQNFNSYSKTYGVLGAALVLLLWLYVTGLVVLAGGELTSEMEKG